MADRRAEKRRAVLLGDGQQRDLAVEADELLDDQFADVAARALAAVVPGVLELLGPLDQRLPLARGGHQRLDNARIADLCGRVAQLLVAFGVEIAGRLQPQLPGGQVADRLAVHREVHGPGARDYLHAFTLEIVEPLGADGLDLGNDDVGVVFGHGGGQGVAVEHVEDFAGVGHLHGGSARIGVARHDGLSEALRRNHELLAQFARAQEQYLFGHSRIFWYCKDSFFPAVCNRCADFWPGGGCPQTENAPGRAGVLVERVWRWRESNPRPNREPESFLHA